MEAALRVEFRRYKELVNHGFVFPKCLSRGILKTVQAKCMNPDPTMTQMYFTLMHLFNQDVNDDYMRYGSFKLCQDNKIITSNPHDCFNYEANKLPIYNLKIKNVCKRQYPVTPFYVFVKTTFPGMKKITFLEESEEIKQKYSDIEDQIEKHVQGSTQKSYSPRSSEIVLVKVN
jgi:hypothetical protein